MANDNEGSCPCLVYTIQLVSLNMVFKWSEWLSFFSYGASQGENSLCWDLVSVLCFLYVGCYSICSFLWVVLFGCFIDFCCCLVWFWCFVFVYLFQEFLAFFSVWCQMVDLHDPFVDHVPSILTPFNLVFAWATYFHILHKAFLSEMSVMTKNRPCFKIVSKFAKISRKIKYQKKGSICATTGMALERLEWHKIIT